MNCTQQVREEREREVRGRKQTYRGLVLMFTAEGMMEEKKLDLHLNIVLQISRLAGETLQSLLVQMSPCCLDEAVKQSFSDYCDIFVLFFFASALCLFNCKIWKENPEKLN